MKRSLILFSVCAFLYGLPLHAKTGTPSRDTNVIVPQSAAQSTVQAFASCMAKAGLSAEQKATYNKIKGFIPDIFCCSEPNSDERAACIDQNEILLQRFSTFLEQAINSPLSDKVSEGGAYAEVAPSNPNPNYDGIIDDGGAGEDHVFTPIKHYLDKIGAQLNKYKSLVEKAK